VGYLSSEKQGMGMFADERNPILPQPDFARRVIVFLMTSQTNLVLHVKETPPKQLCLIFVHKSH
jgi:hypothetical protein